MIAIAEAYEAIKTTLPEGDVAQPPQIDERSGVRIWLDRGFVDRLWRYAGRWRAAAT
jgi:hypothetical protein